MIDEKLLIKELNLRVRTKRSTMEIIRDIIPLVEMQPKVSEQEIRDKAIDTFMIAIETLVKLHGAVVLSEIQGIAEQMKEE